MLPKLPLRIAETGSWLAIVDAEGVWVDAVRIESNGSWPIPDARQAAERRLAELTALIEAATPKCPIVKGCIGSAISRPWSVFDGQATTFWHTEAERDAVYDALVALWHKEHGS